MAQELRVLNLQPPAPPPASPPPSLSLSIPASAHQSESTGTPLDLRDQVSLEGTAEQMRQETQQSLTSKQVIFPQQPEEMPIQDRQTVRDHFHRLFRLPSRKMPPSVTDGGKEPATGT
jgi:hypothetical protein